MEPGTTMNTEGFLFQAFVYLLAAVLSVPFAKRLGLGSVLGYLIAGVVIGPHVLRLVGEESGDVMHVAEFGVVMMLFLVGLELRPNLLWRLRGPILGTGGLQVAATILVIAGVAIAFGLPAGTALAVGMVFAVSSTAIALQSLAEKNLLQSKGGQTSFSVLLFQDIAVIPMLALLPLLVFADSGTVPGAGTHPDHGSSGPGLAPWQHALFVIAVVAAIVLGGRFVIRPVFRFLALTRLSEIFTAAALLLVVAIALAMQTVGLSPALGTFLAGVVLAESEYRHELESDIEPFKGLLLGLFFISVGSSIDLPLIRTQPFLILGLVLGLLLLKFLVLFGIGKITRLENSQNFTFSLALAQGGEFAFVLGSFALQNGVFDQSTANVLVAVVALSMVAAPFLFTLNEGLIQPRFSSHLPDREEDDIQETDAQVILAGFGRFGHIIGRILKNHGVKTTVLDLDADQVELVRKIGVKVYYGDATRAELLRSAGAEKAKLFVIAIDDEDKSLELVETIRRDFPHLKILTRANGRDHAYRLIQKGLSTREIFRETLGSSLDLSIEALRTLGFPAYQVHRAVRWFRRYDEESVAHLAKFASDPDALISAARERVRTIDELFASERHGITMLSDAGWDPPKGERTPAGDAR
jgi:glutathione-regulated potassium-efflux system protein KefB